MLQERIDEKARQEAHEKIVGYFDDKSLEITIRQWIKENYGWSILSAEMNAQLRAFFDLLEQSATEKEKTDIENKLLD